VAVELRVHAKFSSRVDRARLARIARRTLRAERAPGGAALTIYVTTDTEIRALNRKFHATNAATDVLSFPMERSADKPHPYLGDVVISYERARVQARPRKRRGVSEAARWRIADELDLLAVHGILHLLGYDDLTPRGRAKMWKRQEEILGKVAGAA